jgi:hypothetical protein
MMTLSDEALDCWEIAALEKSRWTESLRNGQPGSAEARDAMQSSWDSGSDLYKQLRYQIAELSLVAGEPVNRTANALLVKHEGLRHVIRPAGGADSPEAVVWAYREEIIALLSKFISQTRTDLRVHHGRGEKLEIANGRDHQLNAEL